MFNFFNSKTKQNKNDSEIAFNDLHKIKENIKIYFIL